MYQVIARKWRPQTFEEVTGQEHITRTLRNAIEHGRIAYAYLFSGARGVGKTTTARLFAKALNCHKSDHPTVTPCAICDPTACASCVEIAEGRSIDVLEIDAASNTGVDNVRTAVIGNVGVRPARDRYKVFIIDEVHMLSGAAFNALLKTLEEPPPRVVFIMATTESHKVPDTILSRCQQFEFRTIATARIAERLRAIADAEKIDASDDALREIARAGEGSMRDAQSAFDQVISYGEGSITAADVEAALGIASAALLARVVAAIAETRSAEVFAVVDELVMRGHDLRNFCRDLLVYLRNLLIVKVAGDADALDATETETQRLRAASANFSEADLVRFFHSLSETESSLRTSAHPRYQLEIGLIKLIEMRRLAPLGQVIERLTALEQAIKNGKSPLGVPANTVLPPTGSAGAPPSAPPTKGGNQFLTGGNQTKAAPLANTKINDEEKRDEKDAPMLVSAPPTLTLVSSSSPESKQTTAMPFEPDDWDAAPPPRDVARATSSATGAAIERIKEGLDKRKRPFLVIALEGANQVRLEDGELSVRFGSDAKHLRDALMKPEAIKMLREVGHEVTGRDIALRITMGEETEAADDGQIPRSAADEARQEKQRLREIAERNPLVQSFLRTFHGEIVDVRRLDTENS